jgi:hypothetical protein
MSHSKVAYLWLVAVAVVALIMVSVSRADAQRIGAAAPVTTGVSPRALEYSAALDRLWTTASRLLGAGYGCVLEPDTNSEVAEPTGLILQITGRRYRALAQRAIARAHDGAYARIGYVSSRYSDREYGHIEGVIRGRGFTDWPAGVEEIDRGVLNRESGCPPVVITISASSQITANTWLAKWQKRFGTDRVTSHVVPATAIVPD